MGSIRLELFTAALTVMLIEPHHEAAAATCSEPMRLASVTKLITPDVPPIAAQQGIAGVVHVDVDLDEKGRLLKPTIARSLKWQAAVGL